MRLSLQLYTLRSVMSQDFEGVLRAVKAMGLDFVEGGSVAHMSYAEQKALLDEIGLKLSAIHVGLDQFENDADGVIAAAKELGAGTAILSWLNPEDRLPNFASVAQRIRPFAEKISESGVVFAYHNHAFEFVDEGGKPGYDVLFETLPPSILKAQVDVGWVECAGYDPAAYLTKMADRIDSIHLKDGIKDRHEMDLSPGEGSLNWDEVLAAAKRTTAKFGVVEIDDPKGDPITTTAAAVKFFQDRGIR